MKRYLPTQTVAEALGQYLRVNGFEWADYDAPSAEIQALGLTVRIPNPPARQRAVRRHDLHHILTGYGTDITGEAEVSAWELRRGLGPVGLYVWAIIVSVTLFGLIHSPRRMLQAWRKSPGEGSAFSLDREGYEALLQMTVAEARAAYGIPQEGVATEVRLHDGAPGREHAIEA